MARTSPLICLTLVSAAALGLVGCASVSNPVLAVVQGTFAGLWGSKSAHTVPEKPNPAFRYLRVDVDGRPPVLMALGYVEPGPWGEVEVWYSAGREVLKTSSGRIVGSAGLETDWRLVRFAARPPAWASSAVEATTLERTRDVMPGYRFGVRERLQLSKVNLMPKGAAPAKLPGVVTWYFEQVAEPAVSDLPASIYAVAGKDDGATVVYSRQCLSAELCLHLQPWPVADAVP